MDQVKTITQDTRLFFLTLFFLIVFIIFYPLLVLLYPIIGQGEAEHSARIALPCKVTAAPSFLRFP